MTREKLPWRRDAYTETIRHFTPDGNGQELIVTVGRFDNGRVAEVFVDVPYDKQKHMTALLGKDVSTLISIALQHGATVEELRSAMGRSEVNRLGRMVDMPHTIVGTVLDHMAKKQEPPARAEGS